MLKDRIISAFMFRREVYSEVEKDTTFTTTAWLLVIVVAFLNNFGSNASANFFNWMRNTFVQTIFAIVGFALAAFVMNWVGRALFKADVTFEEMVRTLGLAYVWNVVGIIGALAAFSSLLSCVLAPALVLGWIMLVVSWFVAAKEALDLDTGQTIVTVILGWITFGIIMAIGSSMLNLLGWTATGIGNLFGL
jgi:hypothetical protein